MSGADDVTKNQIQHMIAFIEQEANEKVEEIATKAEEECANEVSRIKQGQRVKINEFYKKRQNQMELDRRIQVSQVQNNARIKVLKVHENHVKNVFDEALKKLVELSESANMYKNLLEGLIAQGLFQLLADKVEIKCRGKDVKLVQEVIPKAVEHFEVTSGRSVKVSVDTSSHLSNDVAGGVELYTLEGRVKVLNTLESRLELISEQILPEIREILFGENSNRKFRD